MSSICQVYSRTEVNDAVQRAESLLDEQILEVGLSGKLHWDVREKMMEEVVELFWKTYDKLKDGRLEKKGYCPFQEEVMEGIECVFKQRGLVIKELSNIVLPCSFHLSDTLPNLFSYLTFA
jgi:hypothetical protein